MPVVRSVRERITVRVSSVTPAAACRSSSRGTIASCSSPRISRGTPGMVATKRPWASSIQTPGAEPWRFSSSAAPSGSMNCRALLSGIARPKRARQRSASFASAGSCSTSGRSNASARLSCVRSSAVGPRPPVVSTAPVRASASRTALDDVVRRVTHGGAAHDAYAEVGEGARDVDGVGVHGESEQQLVADGDEFEVHERKLPRPPRVISRGRRSTPPSGTPARSG